MRLMGIAMSAEVHQLHEDQSPTRGPDLAERTMFLSSELLRWKDKIMESLAVGGDTHSFDNIVADVMIGKLHMYTYEDCCILMTVQEYPLKKIYHCYIGCGKLDALMSKVPEIEKNAKSLGCDALTFSGRFGWKGGFKKLDYRPLMITMAKEI